MESLKEALANLDKAYTAESLRLKQNHQRALLLAITMGVGDAGPAPAVGVQAKKTMRR